MAVTAQATGTQAATPGTEHFVYDPNPAVAATFQFEVDLSPMVSGDVVELRVYLMPLGAGAAAQYLYKGFYGAQRDPIAVSVPFSNELTDASAVRCSIKQTQGTGHSYKWKVLKFA